MNKIVLLGGMFFALLISFSAYRYVEALTWVSPPGPASVEMYGYAWSDNVGWVSFNCVNNSSCGSVDYKVTIDASDGSLDGYAWSDNIGWIRFGGLGAPPAGDSTARLERSGADVYIHGWTRACSVFQSECSGTLKSDEELGGWDGWISFNCANSNSCIADDPVDGVDYGPKLTNSGISTAEPYAWGGDVIGWITMAGVTFDQPYTPGPYMCSHDPEISHTRDIWGNSTQINCAVNQLCSEVSFECKNPMTPSVVNFSANPPLVRSNETSEITWEVAAGTAHTCTVYGPQGPIGTSGLSGFVTSSAVTARTPFELRCQQISTDGEPLVSEIPAATLSVQIVSQPRDI